jgi:antitoxin (DNA-binding transcriptional repressor) of toxin-antitoxin stability system
MTTISLEEAQASLPELIGKLSSGEELLITEDEQPVARLVGPPEPQPQQPRKPGTLKGTILYMAPDFDGPLEDFKEYME